MRSGRTPRSDRFEAGDLGPVPVRDGVALDAGSVTEQSPAPVQGAGDGEADRARIRCPILHCPSSADGPGGAHVPAVRFTLNSSWIMAVRSLGA